MKDKFNVSYEGIFDKNGKIQRGKIESSEYKC
jgi:hypothetical protein